MARRPSPEKTRRDRWRTRVLDGMTPELSAALTPAEVMLLWASATNGDTYFFAPQTVWGLRRKGLTDDDGRLTPKGARWAVRVLEIYDAVPRGDEGRYGWLRRRGYERTCEIAGIDSELSA